MKKISPDSLPRYTTQVEEGWLDYNGHMNVAYYTLVFDQAGEALVTAVGMGEQYTRETGNSWMVLESHSTFQREAVSGDRLTVSSQLLALDPKRIHLFQLMKNEQGKRLASNEQIILHVDLNQRRSAPFPALVMTRLRGLHRQHTQLDHPAEAGRFVGLDAGRPGD